VVCGASGPFAQNEPGRTRWFGVERWPEVAVRDPARSVVAGALPETLVWDRQAGLHAGGGRPTGRVRRVLRRRGVGWCFCEARDPQAKRSVERLQDLTERSFVSGRLFANDLDVRTGGHLSTGATTFDRASQWPTLRPAHAAEISSGLDSGLARAHASDADDGYAGVLCGLHPRSSGAPPRRPASGRDARGSPVGIPAFVARCVVRAATAPAPERSHRSRRTRRSRAPIPRAPRCGAGAGLRRPSI